MARKGKAMNEAAEATVISKSGPGRPTGRSAVDTRAQVLDAAEGLFAENGYEGTSIRNIATAAGVAIAVVTYHVGSKEELFDAVIQRRAEVMEERRAAALATARGAAGEGPIDIETLARGYVMPLLQQAHSGDAGWRNHALLMGRLSNSPLGTSMIHRHYDRSAQSYLEEFQRSLPNASGTAIITGFMGLISLMLFVCARTGRMETLGVAIGDPIKDADVNEEIFRFCVTGLRGLENAD